LFSSLLPCCNAAKKERRSLATKKTHFALEISDCLKLNLRFNFKLLSSITTKFAFSQLRYAKEEEKAKKELRRTLFFQSKRKLEFLRSKATLS
jgi:hypothetical protein